MTKPITPAEKRTGAAIDAAIFSAFLTEHGVPELLETTVDQLPQQKRILKTRNLEILKTTVATLMSGVFPHASALRPSVVPELRKSAWLMIDASIAKHKAALAEEVAKRPLFERSVSDRTERRLVDQLLKLRAEVRAVAKPRPADDYWRSDVLVRFEPPSFELDDQDQEGESFVRLIVEDDRVAAYNECIHAPNAACTHVLSAIDAVLEALAEKKRLPSLASLLKRLAEPAWQRMFTAFDEALAEVAEPPSTQAMRLCFALVETATRYDLAVLRQKQGNREKWHHPKRLGRSELASALPLATSPAERRVLELLLADAEREHDDRLAERAVVLRALAALDGHPRVVFESFHGATTPLAVEKRTLELRAEAEADGAVSLLPAVTGLPGARPDLLTRLDDAPAGILLELDLPHQRCRVIEVPRAAKALLSGLKHRFARVPAEHKLELLRRLSEAERAIPVVRAPALKGERVEPSTKVFVRLDPQPEEAALDVRLCVRPLPGGLPFTPGEGTEEVVGSSGAPEKLVYTKRDLSAETAAAEAVRTTLKLEEELEPYRYHLSGDRALDLLVELEARSAEIETEWPEGQVRRTVRSARAKDLRIGVEDRKDWFELRGEVQLDDQQVPLEALLQALREHRRYVRVSDERWLAISDSLESALSRLDEVATKTREGPQLSHAAPLVLADLAEALGAFHASDRWTKTLETSAALENTVPALSPELQAELRAYQLDGYRWLSRLSSLGFGACLADDMGLGKTVQAIALLLERRAQGPALVVAPTSVGFNWRRELARFAPSLSPIVLREIAPPSRPAAIAAAQPGQVLILGYGLLAREIEALEQVEFGTFVIDEAQALKNSKTDRARAAKRIRAKWRLALTGTPMENHLGELWSLFHVLEPGLLGGREHFKRRFADRQNRSAALSRVIRPFVLRRTKTAVATELPPKTEVQLELTLSADERKLYERERQRAVAELTAQQGQRSPEQQRFSVLASITKLRQLACHPRLIDPESEVKSSKLLRAVSLLRELREEGHRALVFSQFTRLLGLLAQALDAESLSYEYLDGRTGATERERIVDAFQQGSATAFLLSLKAGGTGLNLTAADYVLHLDPWWNPAVEDQATDRAYRIGQTRPVTVYRLVSQGTLEEKILAMHQNKRALFAETLEGTEAAAALSTEELLALLSS